MKATVFLALGFGRGGEGERGRERERERGSSSKQWAVLVVCDQVGEGVECVVCVQRAWQVGHDSVANSSLASPTPAATCSAFFGLHECVCVRVCTHTHARARTHTHTHTQKQTQTHKKSQKCAPVRPRAAPRTPESTATQAIRAIPLLLSSLELGDTQSLCAVIRARLGTAAHF